MVRKGRKNWTVGVNEIYISGNILPKWSKFELMRLYQSIIKMLILAKLSERLIPKMYVRYSNYIKIKLKKLS